jgi:photosystem II stability/assembly factor-like uncharacterized protein
VSVLAPPRRDELEALIEEPVSFPDPLRRSRDELDALIKEARQRARRRRLTYTAVTVVAIAIAAGFLAIYGGGGGGRTRGVQNGHGRPSARAQRVLHGERTPLAALRGRYVSNVSFVDARHGWALLVPGCVTRALSCSAIANVVETNDGGRSWAWLASLPAGSSVRRLSLRVGFVLGSPSGSFMTTDGSHHWVLIRRAIEAVTSLAGRVATLTYRGSGCPAACDVGLRLAAVGASSFAPVRSFLDPSRGFGDTLVGAGRDLYAVGFGHPEGGAGTAYSRLAISRDAGRSWSLRGDPCRLPNGRPELDAWQVAAAGRYVALLCVPRSQGTASIVLSRDAGRTFMRMPSPLNDSASEIALDARGDLAAANGLVSGGSFWNYRLAVSFDRGRTWRIALKSRAPAPSDSAQRMSSLAIFSRSLRWVTGARTLWRSDDAGSSWQVTSLP